MAEIFILHPRNSDFVNGRCSKLPGTSKWLLLAIWAVPVLCGIVGIICSVISVNAWSSWNVLDKTGIETDGIIIKRKGKETNTYIYKFTANDRIYLGQYSTNNILALHDGEYTEIGDSVKIIYAPDNPDNSMISRCRDMPIASSSSAVFFFVMSFAFGYGVFKVVGGKKENQPEQIQLVRGELTAIDTSPSEKDSSKQTVLSYEFVSPATGRQIRHEKTLPYSLSDPVPVVGQPVAIAFVDDNRKWLL